MEFHTVYDSFESGPKGRDYIGKHSTDDPYDDYRGSFKDDSFNPDDKIIFAYAKTKEGAVWLEIMFQRVFSVVEDPQYVNRSYQTSVGFSYSRVGEKSEPEHCRKIAEALKGRKLSHESIVKRQNTRGPYAKGEESKKWGSTHTLEAREKIKEKRKNQIITDETRQKLSNALKGRKLSQEHRARLSESRKGGPGRPGPKSEEEKQKISESTKRAYQDNKWQCLVTGFISTAQGLSNYQKKRNIDTSLRVKLCQIP